MTADSRLTWLKRVLLCKTMLCFAVWGLPALIGPASLLAVMGMPFPADPIHLRSFGALATAWGVAYWYAYKDPLRNVAIVKAGVVDNALGTLAVLYVALTTGVSSAFVWVSAILTTLMFVLLLVLMPREAK